MAITDVLDRPAVYRLWQAPFARRKLAPLISSGVLERAQSVLDVGCGPGTNAAVLGQIGRYLGIDLSQEYIAYAKRRFPWEFRVADVTEGLVAGEFFDLIVMNSLMHHLDDDGASGLLSSIARVLSPGGEIHVLDLVLAESGIPRRMALSDRGEHPRTPDQWASLVEPWLVIQMSTTYPLGLGPIELWRMIHMVLTVPPVRS